MPFYSMTKDTFRLKSSQKDQKASILHSEITSKEIKHFKSENQLKELCGPHSTRKQYATANSHLESMRSSVSAYRSHRQKETAKSQSICKLQIYVFKFIVFKTCFVGSVKETSERKTFDPRYVKAPLVFKLSDPKKTRIKKLSPQFSRAIR